MSSESFGGAADKLFRWHDALDRADYVFAHYRVDSRVAPERAALAMAREQSACTDRIPDDSGARDALERATARLVRIAPDAGHAGAAMLPPYRLSTPVYGDDDWFAAPVAARITLAFPWRNFGASVTRMFNHICGELPRLGFIAAIRLERVELPPPLLGRFRGPRHGIGGIRERLGIHARPLFCRSTRPAVGLALEQMRRINRAVLEGGFDLVKDDELSGHGDPSADAIRCETLQADVSRIATQLGEGKGYFVSLLDDPAQANRLARVARDAGVFGAMLAPGLQGFGVLGEIGDLGLIVLAHNSGSDVRLRSPQLGLHPAVWILFCRLAGADCIMLPGEFASAGMSENDAHACIHAATAPLGALHASLPILAGGKRAERLGEYAALVGSQDFMLIVAAAVDEHPDGIQAGAREFRAEWERLGSLHRVGEDGVADRGT